MMAIQPGYHYTPAQFKQLSPEDQAAYTEWLKGQQAAGKDTKYTVDQNGAPTGYAGDANKDSQAANGSFIGDVLVPNRQLNSLLTGGLSETLRDPDKVDTASLDQLRAKALADAANYDKERAAANQAPYVAGSVAERTIAAPDVVDRADLGAARTVTSRDVDVPQLGPAAQAAGDQVRSLQLENAQALNDAATGKAPSVAEALYRRKSADINQQQLGLAAQARGAAAAGARRAALTNIGGLQNRAAADIAAIRADEIAKARGQETTALSGIRSTDTDVSKFNTGETNKITVDQGKLTADVGGQNADRGLRADTTSANAVNQRTETQGKLDVDVNTGNVVRKTGVESQNVANALNVATGNRDAAITAKQIQDAKDASLRASSGQAIGAAAGIVGQDLAIQQGNINTANQAAGRAGEFTTSVVGKALAGPATPSVPVPGAAPAPVPYKAGQELLEPGQAGPVTSDERVKKDVSPVPEDAAKHLAETIQAMRFKYKDDPSAQEHFGVMAQDLEKDPLGRQMVSERPDGVKQVDYQGLAAVLLAAALKGRKEARR